MSQRPRAWRNALVTQTAYAMNSVSRRRPLDAGAAPSCAIRSGEGPRESPRRRAVPPRVPARGEPPPYKVRGWAPSTTHGSRFPAAAAPTSRRGDGGGPPDVRARLRLSGSAGWPRVIRPRAVAASLHGMRPTLAPRPLEMLIGSISAQQVNLTFAFACAARLCVARDGVASPGGQQSTPFRAGASRPLPGSRRPARDEVLHAQGRVHPRPHGAWARQARSDTRWPRHQHAGDQAAHRLRGLGRWTANWYLARCCGAVIPAPPATWPSARPLTITTGAGGTLIKKKRFAAAHGRGGSSRASRSTTCSAACASPTGGGGGEA